ncbi:MAG TPA: hypothetical protein VME45_20390 [Stellaceae bacterium]|nr:hypothetical protein [Stellaceae bacterium]
MATVQIFPAALGNSADKWKELLDSLTTNNQQAQVSMATPADHSAGLSLLNAPFANEALKSLSTAPQLDLHLNFGSGVAQFYDVQKLLDLAKSAQQKAAAPAPAPPLQQPKITVSQGLQGGAAIGGLGGLGLAFFMEGLKSTAAATGNPAFLGVGIVIMGMALGAASGALIANGTPLTVTVPKLCSVEVNGQGSKSS